jgi:hypothetical protein
MLSQPSGRNSAMVTQQLIYTAYPGPTKLYDLVQALLAEHARDDQLTMRRCSSQPDSG